MGNSFSSSSSNDSSEQYSPNQYMQSPQPMVQYEYALKDPNLIVRPFLYLGSAYGMRNPSLLEYLGITHVLNMAMELPMSYEIINNPRIKLKHIFADDSERYNIRYDFDQAFDFIDEARAQGGKVLVHCMMGISRSATIVIAYLMSRYNMSLNDAYKLTKSRRSETNPNRYFMSLLSQYENELFYYRNQGYQYNPAPFNPIRASGRMKKNEKSKQRPVSYVTNYPSVVINKDVNTARNSAVNYAFPKNY